MEWGLPGRVESLPEVRRLVGEALEGRVSPEVLDDLRLVAHELFADAVRAGPGGGLVQLRIEAGDDGLAVSLRAGGGIDPAAFREGNSLALIAAMGGRSRVVEQPDSCEAAVTLPHPTLHPGPTWGDGWRAPE